MIARTKARILNWYRQPINPVFLELSDKKLHLEFQVEARRMTINRTKNFALILVVFTIGALASNWREMIN